MTFLPSFFSLTVLRTSIGWWTIWSVVITGFITACDHPASPASNAPSAAAQHLPSSTDSLRSIWFSKVKGQTDSFHLAAGNALQQIYASNNLDSLRIISNEMRACGEETGNRKWITSGWYGLGIVYRHLGDMDSSRIALNHAIRSVEDEKDDLLCHIYLNLGSAWYDAGITDSALYYLNHAMLLAQRTGRSESLGTIYGDLGATYQDQGKLMEALDYYHKALEHGNYYDSITVTMNTGFIFESLGLMDDANSNYLQVINLSEKSTDRATLVQGYCAIMHVTPTLSQMQGWMDKGLLVCDSLNSPLLKLLLLTEAGRRYLDSLDLEKAAGYLNAGNVLTKQLNEESSSAEITLLLGRLDYLQGRYQQSLQKCLTAQSFLVHDNNTDGLSVLFGLLSKNMEALGRPAEALNYLHKKEKIDASNNDTEYLKSTLSAYLKNKSRQEQIALQTAKENAEALTKASHARERLSYGFFGSVILLLTGIVLFYFNYSRQKAVAARELALANSALIAEQDKLKHSNEQLRRFSGVISHDILSNLDLILSTGNVLITNTKTVSDRWLQYYQMTQQTSRYLKTYCLDLLQQAKEMQQALAFYAPMPAVMEVLERFGPALREKGFTIDVNNLPPSPLPPVQITHIFQNLVSNTLRYSSDQASPYLYIGGEKDAAGNDCWVVADNGPGISPEQWAMVTAGNAVSNKGQGIGLSQVLATLHTFGAHLDVEPAIGGGTKFTISFSPR